MSASSQVAGAPQSRNLILAAMIFAVAMTFIDQTIVSIAAPEIQKELGLTNTGVQWAINAYLLSLAALVRVRRAPGRHGRSPQDGDSRRDPVRGILGAVRAHAEGVRSPRPGS